MRGTVTGVSIRDAARRFTRPGRPATADDTSIRPSQFFRLAYGREPTTNELEYLDLLVGEQVRTTSEARAILRGFDHQQLPTSFDLRIVPDDLVLVELPEFRLWVDRRDVSVSAVILDRRGWEPHVDSVLADVLRPGDVFVDVGANVGYHTFLAASLVGAGGAVVAIEPSAENCRLLWLSKHENGAEQVSIHALALDRTAGLRYLTSHLGSNGGLLPDDVVEVRSGRGSFVTAARLDDLHVGAVRLMKVDVEGAEFAVLDGAVETVASQRPHLILEFSAEMARRVSGVEPFDALQRLLDHGYALSVLDRSSTRRVEFSSAADLRASWGDDLRIEDLLLVPA